MTTQTSSEFPVQLIADLFYPKMKALAEKHKLLHFELVNEDLLKKKTVDLIRDSFSGDEAEIDRFYGLRGDIMELWFPGFMFAVNYYGQTCAEDLDLVVDNLLRASGYPNPDSDSESD